MTDKYLNNVFSTHFKDLVNDLEQIEIIFHSLVCEEIKKDVNQKTANLAKYVLIRYFSKEPITNSFCIKHLYSVSLFTKKVTEPAITAFQIVIDGKIVAAKLKEFLTYENSNLTYRISIEEAFLYLSTDQSLKRLAVECKKTLESMNIVIENAECSITCDNDIKANLSTLRKNNLFFTLAITDEQNAAVLFDIPGSITNAFK